LDLEDDVGRRGLGMARSVGEGLTDDLEQLSSNGIRHNGIDWAVETEPGRKPELLAVLVH
jgi:hypothetical protein